MNACATRARQSNIIAFGRAEPSHHALKALYRAGRSTDAEKTMPNASKEAAGLSEDLTPICALGASAGGIKALQQFFKAVDPTLGIAYVVIVHLAPDFPSHLSEI